MAPHISERIVDYSGSNVGPHRELPVQSRVIGQLGTGTSCRISSC